MEKTLAIIKPDGVGKKLVGEIIRRFESEGLELRGLKMLRPSRKEIEGFYEMHKGKPFFEPFISFMLSGPIAVSIWEAENAVLRVREIIGATNPEKANPGTLRKLYGTDNRKNLIHASDSIESSEREIARFFKPDEILDYNAIDWMNK